MIKFFQKIRQKQVETGKVKNYLLYAIGEIVLVVIGILIALQINNWNEEYKDSQLEQSYYCKLLEDVNQDHVLLTQLMKDNQERIVWVNKGIHLLQQEKVNRKEVVQAMQKSINKIRFNFKPSLSAFDDLKSSGKLNIIKDLSIKKKLLNYYAVQAGYGDIQDIVADASLDAYLNPSKDFEEVGFQDIDFVKDEIDIAIVNLEKLKPRSFPSLQIRKQLLTEIILHLNTNARKKNVYKTMEKEVLDLKEVLEKKCASKE